MASFKGEYDHSIDSKGRVSFPAKLRKYLPPQSQDSFVILKGLERCLLLYPQEHWQQVQERLSEMNKFRTQERTVLRNFLRSADDLTLDKHNRLAIPSKLMEWASIDSKVIFIGMGDSIELWSPDILEKADQELDSDTYREMFENVMGDGFK
ncbi:division/cell wall cluster transcriptional repressor MraZ [Balneolaceae bacterium ANBcel3]|nr:division/cell wall cluster transcriptional repressor MraZ [Balneolaceae bacterium ANBcel3]